MSGEAFALERLRQDPELDFEAVRLAGHAAGISLQPIQFGRARRQLGLSGAAAQQPSSSSSSSPPSAEQAAPAAPTELATDKASDAEQTPPPVPGPGLTRPSTPAFEFLVESLRAEPSVSYGELKRQADDKGLKIAPIMYGRAKALLGLVPVRPRGQGKNRRKANVTTLPRAEADSAEQFSKQIESVDNIEDLVAIVKQLDAERRRLRSTLANVMSQIGESLS